MGRASFAPAQAPFEHGMGFVERVEIGAAGGDDIACEKRFEKRQILQRRANGVDARGGLREFAREGRAIQIEPHHFVTGGNAGQFFHHEKRLANHSFVFTQEQRPGRVQALCMRETDNGEFARAAGWMRRSRAHRCAAPKCAFPVVRRR